MISLFAYSNMKWGFFSKSQVPVAAEQRKIATYLKMLML
jgi:hypothetical protein